MGERRKSVCLKVIIFALAAVVFGMLLFIPLTSEAARKQGSNISSPEEVATVLSCDPERPGKDGWFDRSPKVTLSRNKAGVTYYRWDSLEGPWSMYGDSIIVPGGVHTLYYFSVDLSDRQEPLKSCQFKVKFSPTSSLYSQESLSDMFLAKVSSSDDTTPPSPPEGLAVSSVGQDWVSFEWEPVQGSEGLAGYYLYRDGQFIGLSIDTHYQDRDLKESTSYSYRVRAYDEAGNVSDYSQVLVAVTLSSSREWVPSPCQLVAQPDEKLSLVNLSWTTTENEKIDHYNLYRSSNLIGGSQGSIAPVIATTPQTSYSDGTVTLGNIYYYAVAPVGPKGRQGPLSNWVKVSLISSEASPHGTYSSGSALCTDCHFPHEGGYGGEKELCLSCHAGLGSRYDVKSDFDKAGRESFHGVDDVLSCTDCHGAHGKPADKPRLLAAGKKWASKGNEVCWACHGLASSGKGYQIGGDHQSSYAKSAHSTLTWSPSSGTNIQCENCHVYHSSDTFRLTAFRGDTNYSGSKLCLNCHRWLPGPEGRDIYAEFTSTAYQSRHDLFDLSTPPVAGQTGLQCSSCHGPHTVATGALEKITDPDNTKKLIADKTSFCLKCHDDRPPQRKTTPTAIVPYTITFPQVSDSFFGGWDKSAYPLSGHGLADYGCNQCHYAHASQSPGLLTAGQEKLCLTCHLTGEPKKSPEVSPTSLSQVLSSLEVVNAFVLVERPQPKCTDCHDPHQVGRGTHDFGFNLASNVLKGASGVEPAEAPPGFSPTGYMVRNPVEYEYQLCYKCHSSYTKAGWIADRAGDFNPNNRSFHPVQGIGKNSSLEMANSLAKAGLTVTSQLYCSDCHNVCNIPISTPAVTSSASSISPQVEKQASGHYGSPQPYLLRLPYRTAERKRSSNAEQELGKDEIRSDFALCFICHESEPFWKTDDSMYTRFKKHRLHVQKVGAVCSCCHSNPHGSNIGPTKDATGDFNGLVSWDICVESNSAGKLDWVKTGAKTGRCSLRCHDRDHQASKY